MAALARRARELGARMVEGVAVRRILVERGAVAGVETGDGLVSAPVVVTAAGGWTPRLLAPLGVEIPIVNTLHRIGVFERPAGFPPHPVCGDFVNQPAPLLEGPPGSIGPTPLLAPQAGSSSTS